MRGCKLRKVFVLYTGLKMNFTDSTKTFFGHSVSIYIIFIIQRFSQFNLSGKKKTYEKWEVNEFNPDTHKCEIISTERTNTCSFSPNNF